MVPFLLSSIFLFYVALSGNFLDGLFSPQMQLHFHKHKWMKHFFGFLILLFTISLVNTHKKLWVTIMIAVFMYIWFLLTTKINIKFILGLVGAMALGFIFAEVLRRKYHVSGDDNEDDQTDDADTIKSNTMSKALIIVCIAIFILIIISTLWGAVQEGRNQLQVWKTNPKGKNESALAYYFKFVWTFIFTHELSREYKDVTQMTLQEHVARVYELLGKQGLAQQVRQLSSVEKNLV